MLADELDYVLGVDTHRDEHVMAVVTAPAGAVVAGAATAANARGYRELLRVAEQHAPGRRAWAIEGTGSYGAGLSRYLCARRRACSRSVAYRAGASAPRRKADAFGRGQDRAGRRLASDTLAVSRRKASGARRCGCCWSHAAAPSNVRRAAADSTACRHRHRPGAATPTAAPAAGGQVARPLQPLAPHQLNRSRRAREQRIVFAASPAESGQRPAKLTSSNARSSPTCAHSHRRCSTSLASARSSPPN